MAAAAFVVALVAAGVQAEVAMVCAGLTLLAAGGPLLWRDRGAALVAACVGVAFGAGLAVLHHLAEDHARDYVAEHPPPAVTTMTTQTFVTLPASGCANYPYSEMGTCDDGR